MRHNKALKSLILATAVTGALLMAGAAHAQSVLGTGGTTGTTTGTSAFAASDFYVSVQQQTVPPVSLTLFQLSRFFNKANCDCATPVNLFISLLSSGIAKRATAGITSGTVYVVLGYGCSSVVGLQNGHAAGACLQVATEPVLTLLSKASYTIPTDVKTLSTYFNSAGVTTDAGTDTTGTAAACTSPIGQTFTQTVNFNFDFGSGAVDLSVPLTLTIDLVPPPAPTDVDIQGGGQALAMSWASVDTSITTDLLGYQVLCSRADQYQVFNDGSFDAAFQTCPATQTGTGVEGLDPAYVCSGLVSAQATSDRVEVLQNGITYAAAVVAIDNSGNASEPIVNYGTPVKTLSFYDVYRNETPQGAATGGFCALAPGRPRAKSTVALLALFAFGGVGLTIARRRRRR